MAKNEISNLTFNQKLGLLRKTARFIRSTDLLFKDGNFRKTILSAKKTDASLINLKAIKIFGKTLSVEKPSYTSLIVFPYSILKHIIPIKDNKIIFGSFPQAKIDITSETSTEGVEEKVKQEYGANQLGLNPNWYGYEINRQQLYIEYNCVVGPNKNLYFDIFKNEPYTGYVISPIEWNVYPEYDMVITDKMLVSKNDNPNDYLSIFISMILDKPSYSMLGDDSFESIIDNLIFELEYYSKKYGCPYYMGFKNQLTSNYYSIVKDAIALMPEEKEKLQHDLIDELNKLVKTLKKRYSRRGNI